MVPVEAACAAAAAVAVVVDQQCEDLDQEVCVEVPLATLVATLALLAIIIIIIAVLVLAYPSLRMMPGTTRTAGQRRALAVQAQDPSVNQKTTIVQKSTETPLHNIIPSTQTAKPKNHKHIFLSF